MQWALPMPFEDSRKQKESCCRDGRTDPRILPSKSTVLASLSVVHTCRWSSSSTKGLESVSKSLLDHLGRYLGRLQRSGRSIQSQQTKIVICWTTSVFSKIVGSLNPKDVVVLIEEMGIVHGRFEWNILFGFILSSHRQSSVLKRLISFKDRLLESIHRSKSRPALRLPKHL